MIKEIHVPDIGDFSDVDVIEVLVSVGDTIAIDDALITLESDKASMDIPAPEAGTVTEVKVAVGDSVSEGSLILSLDVADATATDNASSKEGKPAAKAPAAADPAPSGSGGGYGGTSLEEIKVPDIGDFSDVDVIEVLVQAGDTISADDALITLESDKASMDVPAPKGGKVHEVKVAVGDTVSEGSLILVLESGSPAPVPAQQASTPAPAASASASAPTQTVDADAFKRVHASPSVRRIARELSVDLTQVTPTGRNGRVTQDDVKGFQTGASSAASAAAPAAQEVPAKKKKPAADLGELGIPEIAQPDWSKFGDVSTVPMSRINKLSARHLAKSWLNTPQVTHFDETDVTGLEAYRKSLKAQAEKQGVRMTPLAFYMKAVTAALKAFPKFNSAMDADWENLIQRDFYNIAIAVDTPDGLVVPVVRDVDKKGLFDLARDLGEISVKARDGKLKADDLQGGCFTISSLGGIGGTNFTPLVNAPQVGILGLTRSQSRLVRNEQGEIVDALIQPLAVSYDHRVIDGAYAAKFTSYLAFLLSDVRNLIL
ncbi:MAG: dihydrolipoyllysine-residue acetyltransferase [Gammaproteobacteria bacterium]